MYIAADRLGEPGVFPEATYSALVKDGSAIHKKLSLALRPVNGRLAVVSEYVGSNASAILEPSLENADGV